MIRLGYCILLSSSLLCLTGCGRELSPPMMVYLAPDGDDANEGTVDAPLQTLEAARQQVRQYVGQRTVEVILTDGTYYLPAPFVLEAVDAGTPDAPIVYRAENEGKAVISGGTSLELQWQPAEEIGAGVYQAATPAGLEMDQLFINGEQQRMARYPNFDPTRKTDPYQGYSPDAFSVERARTWDHPVGGYIHAIHRHRWGGYHYRITGKDEQGQVTYAGGWQNNRQMGMHEDYRMVENIFEELDAPGEWYHDAASNRLFFMPPAALNLEQAEVVVTRLRHLIEFRGSEAEPVRHIRLQGLVFRHAARTFMDTREPLLRSDWTIYRGGAVVLQGTEAVEVVDCEFDQLGGNAIFVDGYNRDTLIQGCHIHHTGASAICFIGSADAVRNPLFEYGETNDLNAIDLTPGPKTNEFPANGTIADCLIHNIGTVERQTAGVQIMLASEISVRDTSIYETSRAGINIGDGRWGGHLIERVDVFDTVLETSDHGSFNSWGRDRFWRKDHLKSSQQAVDANPELPFLDAMKTTVIRNSRWRCDHGWDIDLDDGSSNYDIYNNLMLSNGLKLREGFRRHVWNNIAVNNTTHPHVWFRRSGDEIYSNIWMQPYATARMKTPYPEKTVIGRNLYFMQDDSGLEKARSLGWGEGSIVADPLFVDPENGDFRVQPGSPAFEIGFKNFDMNQFGVKKPALKAIARTPVITPPGEKIKQSGESKGTPKQAKTKPIPAVWLGATLRALADGEFSAYGVAKEEGGVAMTVVPENAAAAHAGLEANDLIQAVNGARVTSTVEFFKALAGSEASPLALKVVRNQQVMEMTLTQIPYIQFETANTANEFQKLPLSASVEARITANQKTGNEPLQSLTDGELNRNYGPVFANGIQNGAYKMDLGQVESIAAITSWSFDMNNVRGAQKITLFGSQAEIDPGWDWSAWTPLGTIDTTGTAIATAGYTAAALRAPVGQTLGTFRWILWVVSPVTPAGGGENTAFQELAVEVVKP